jgi:hypothetical protein
MAASPMSTIDAKILAVVERLDPARQQQLLDYEVQQVAQRAEQRV